jgi:hypothetical protein
MLLSPSIINDPLSRDVAERHMEWRDMVTKKTASLSAKLAAAEAKKNTFSPRIRPYSLPDRDNIDVYEAMERKEVLAKARKEENVKAREVKKLEAEGCTFQPSINSRSEEIANYLHNPPSAVTALTAAAIPLPQHPVSPIQKLRKKTTFADENDNDDNDSEENSSSITSDDNEADTFINSPTHSSTVPPTPPPRAHERLYLNESHEKESRRRALSYGLSTFDEQTGQKLYTPKVADYVAPVQVPKTAVAASADGGDQTNVSASLSSPNFRSWRAKEAAAAAAATTAAVAAEVQFRMQQGGNGNAVDSGGDNADDEDDDSLFGRAAPISLSQVAAMKHEDENDVNTTYGYKSSDFSAAMNTSTGSTAQHHHTVQEVASVLYKDAAERREASVAAVEAAEESRKKLSKSATLTSDHSSQLATKYATDRALSAYTAMVMSSALAASVAAPYLIPVPEGQFNFDTIVEAMKLL